MTDTDIDIIAFAGAAIVALTIAIFHQPIFTWAIFGLIWIGQNTGV